MTPAGQSLMQESLDNSTTNAKTTPAAQPVTCDGVPAQRAERLSLRRAVEEYLQTTEVICPASSDELRRHAHAILTHCRAASRFDRYVAVLINNALWADRLAAIPYNRRLLLMPQCLRSPQHCQAQIDELGLTCRQCGHCPLGQLQHEAQQLGYVVLIAEGSPIVMTLIESGQIHAVVGASCLAVLEKVFPLISAAAIPAQAIPLLRDGCVETAIDLDDLFQAIYLSTDAEPTHLNLPTLHRDVRALFTPESLDAHLGPARNQTQTLARDWLLRGGKRWRPFLAVAVYRCLADSPEQTIPLAPAKARSRRRVFPQSLPHP